MDENVEGLLAYAFTWISGLILYFVEKKNKFVRFHAVQSMIVFVPLLVLTVIFPIFSTFLGFIPFVGPIIALFGWLLALPAGLAALVLWILLMIKAYQGEKFKLPVVGDIAEKHA